MARRRRDPYGLALEAAAELARSDPRNRRLIEARSLILYLPWVAVYPLRPYNLALVSIIGSLLWFAGQMITGIPLAIALLGAAVTYLLEIVVHTSNGFGTSPTFTSGHYAELSSNAIKGLLLVAVAVGVVLHARDSDQPTALPLALGLTSIVLTCALAQVAIERSLTAAFDPRRWIGLITGGGWSLALVFALVAIALYAAAGAIRQPSATDVLGQHEFSGVGYAIFVMYALFAGAHLLGAALYLQRGALGTAAILRAKTDAERVNESVAEAAHQVMAQASALADREAHAEADAQLRTASLGHHDPRQFLEALFDLAMTRPTPYFAEATGQRLLSHLVSARQWPRALEVLMHASYRWSSFQPGTKLERVRLAEAALERGDARAFRHLVEGCAALGDAPERIELAFLAARWLAERDRDEPAALAQLRALQLDARGHPLQKRIAAYAAAIEPAAG